MRYLVLSSMFTCSFQVHLYASVFIFYIHFQLNIWKSNLIPTIWSPDFAHSLAFMFLCLCTLITFEPFTLNWISRKLNRPAYRCYYHIQPAKFRRQVNDKHLRRNKLKTANKLHLKPLIESIAHLLLLH